MKSLIISHKADPDGVTVIILAKLVFQDFDYILADIEEVDTYVINNLDKYFPINSIDVIVCNPPYFLLENESSVSNKDYLKMARHEGNMTIEMIARLSKIYLKDGGSLFLIQRADRLFEIRDVLIKNNLAIKELQFIYHDLEKCGKLVLVEARKSGKEHGLKVLKPIILEKESSDVNG